MRQRTIAPLKDKIIFVIRNLEDVKQFFERERRYHGDPVLKRLAVNARQWFGFSERTTDHDIVRGLSKAYSRVKQANHIKVSAYDSIFS